MTFDVLVIGAGPAGSSCAYALAARGARVALVDRCAFPRDKLCGGLLSGRARTHFEANFGQRWGPAIEYIATGADFYAGERFLNGITGHRPIYFTTRRAFDSYLLGLAQAEGAVCLLGRSAEVLSWERPRIRLRDGTELRGDFLVGGDGVHSLVARSLGPRKFDKRSQALGLEIELPRAEARFEARSPAVYLGAARWGYGWVFPKADTYTIGMGGLLERNPDLRRRFGAFLRRVCGTVPDIAWRGHYLPFGAHLRRPGRGCTLLVGDAAGLVEPLTGEGIAFAIQSGRLAGQAILGAAEQGDRSAALPLYLQPYREMTRGFVWARLLRALVFSPTVEERLIMRLLPRSPGAIRSYLDLLSGELEYSAFVRFVLRRLASGTLRALAGS